MLCSSLPPVEELMSYLRYLCLPDSIVTGNTVKTPQNLIFNKGNAKRGVSPHLNI